ncbi:hypothetical protein MMC19_001618 [Ptychographa xylographoides]|nr:hypothetical protein [Ptychographa xylographoides]
MALAVTLLLFPALAAADNGTDTYNNLFSDLSPLIALFGEQVSKQFLSQSLTVADCILFASAPLGILTGVVSSVRLGGYVWLRAIIGRASESRGAAALELTSATSSGICELWDGKNVIRIQGTAEILSILFLDLQGVQPSADPNDEETDREPLLKEMSKLEEPRQFVVGFEAGKSLGWIASQYEVALQLQRSARKQIRGSWEQGEDTLPSEITPPGVRNPIPPIPPNIALNASSRPSSILVRVAALFGVIIQSAVLVLAGLVTYKFIPQDSDSTYNYALPLLIAGTVLVFSGMTICAWIVIKSSRQEQVRIYPISTIVSLLIRAHGITAESRYS